MAVRSGNEVELIDCDRLEDAFKDVLHGQCNLEDCYHIDVRMHVA